METARNGWHVRVLDGACGFLNLFQCCQIRGFSPNPGGKLRPLGIFGGGEVLGFSVLLGRLRYRPIGCTYKWPIYVQVSKFKWRDLFRRLICYNFLLHKNLFGWIWKWGECWRRFFGSRVLRGYTRRSAVELKGIVSQWTAVDRSSPPAGWKTSLPLLRWRRKTSFSAGQRRTSVDRSSLRHDSFKVKVFGLITYLWKKVGMKITTALHWILLYYLGVLLGVI